MWMQDWEFAGGCEPVHAGMENCRDLQGLVSLWIPKWGFAGCCKFVDAGLEICRGW